MSSLKSCSLQALQIESFTDIGGQIGRRGDTAGLGFCAKNFEAGGGGVEAEGIFTTQITGKVIMNPPAVEEVTFWTRDFEMVRPLFNSLTHETDLQRSPNLRFLSLRCAYRLVSRTIHNQIQEMETDLLPVRELEMSN